MFGQEMFSSRAATPSASERIRATSTYSSSVVPQMLTMTTARRAAQLRQLLGDEALHADALQADRVQHARRGFDDPRRRMTFALGEEQPFDGDAAERSQVHGVGVFDAVAEAAARGDQRIGEAERSDREARDPPSVSHGLPHDALRVEDGAVDAGARVVQLSAVASRAATTQL